MLLADHDAIAGEQFFATRNGCDLDTLDIELGDVTALRVELHPLLFGMLRHHGDFLARLRCSNDGQRLVLAARQMRDALSGADRGYHRREPSSIARGISCQPCEIRGRRLDCDRTMRAIGAARSENGPVAEIGAAIDQCVVSVRDALEEHLDVEFVAITREQQEAPIAIAERKGKYRILVEANLDRLLGRQRAQPPAPRREAAKVPCRTDRRPRLPCAYSKTH